jgi:hypothetical protein
MFRDKYGIEWMVEFDANFRRQIWAVQRPPGTGQRQAGTSAIDAIDTRIMYLL